MFSILISEKGGAERKESFEKSEINVGRVQGNDLVLPKGNVSKHHARLLFRDGRCIVTDLKSTNGTYVNGRKIAQATIVREADKIYIGDFVLRLDAPAQQQPPANIPMFGTAGPEEEQVATAIRDESKLQEAAAKGLIPQAPMVPTLQASGFPSPPVHSPPQPPVQPPGAARPSMGMPPLPSAAAQAPSAPPPIAVVTQAPTVTPEPSMDVDMQSVPPPPVPASVARPPASRLQTTPLQQSKRPSVPPPIPGPSAPSSAPPSVRPGPVSAGAPLASVGGGFTQPFQQKTYRPAVPVRASLPPRETAAQAAKRLALVTLLDRISSAVDLSSLKASPILSDELTRSIEAASTAQAKSMRDEGEAPEGIDLESLAREAHRELTGLGALGTLLEDEEITEVHCVRFDQILCVRAGVLQNADIGFTNEEAFVRVIARLAHQSGIPLQEGETLVERRIGRSSEFVAALAPSVPTSVVSVRRRQRMEMSLEDLVRGGSMSRAMASFLEAAGVAGANILVCGALPRVTLGVLAALAGAGLAPTARIVVVHGSEEIALEHAHVTPIAATDAETADALRTALKLGVEKVIVPSLGIASVAATIDTACEGACSILASINAQTLRHGLSRLSAQLVMTESLTLEAARDVVGEAFEIAIEVTTLADGRIRITRIAELGGADTKGIAHRDIFVSTDNAEGGFTATGVVPRLANDLAIRGVRVDPALFRRATK